MNRIFIVIGVLICMVVLVFLIALDPQEHSPEDADTDKSDIEQSVKRSGPEQFA